VIGFAPPLFYGRGIFNIGFGLLPHRKRLTSVGMFTNVVLQYIIITTVGAPIRVTECATPTQEQIDDIHSQYVAGLKQIFDDHKHNYGLDDDAVLKVV
jgi:2-acylglycerol O-acyltransferase 2